VGGEIDLSVGTPDAEEKSLPSKVPFLQCLLGGGTTLLSCFREPAACLAVIFREATETVRVDVSEIALGAGNATPRLQRSTTWLVLIALQQRKRQFLYLIMRHCSAFPRGITGYD
jgi:hypothetical protein